MKKITLFLLVFFVSSVLMAQSTCNQTFSASGSDDDPTVLTITAAEINCADPATPTALTLTNSAGNLTNAECATNGTDDWYEFTLSVTGGDSDGASVTGCAGELNGTDITGFTSLTITSADLDDFFDDVTIQIDVQSTFVSATPPICDSTLTETTDVSVEGDISWSQASGGPSSYDLTVGTASGLGDVFSTADVGNVTTINLGTLDFGTTYFVTIVPKNANGSATGCTEQSFTTEPLPPAGQSCFNPIAATVETDCSAATPNTVDFANSVDVGPYTCDTTANNNGNWFEFTSPATDGVTISSTDALAEYVILDDCNGTEIACGTFTGNSVVILLSPNTQFKLAVWKDGATTGTTDICIEEFTTPNAPNCAEAPIMPMDGATGVDASTNEVTFSWTAPSTGDAPSGYEIFLGTESGNLTSLGVTPNVSEPITGIEGGTTYYWQVVPENLGGSATGCPEWSFTTAPIAPPTTIGTITINNCGESDSFTNTYVIGEVTWVELVVVAEGCDFSFNTLTSTIGDSEIGIYSQGGVFLGSNDDAASGGLLSELLATDFAAGTYYIAASAFNVTFGPAFGVTTADTNDVGDITITVTSSVPNDECADAEAVTFGNEVSASNTGATDSNVTGTCFTGNIRDVWYSAVADATGEIYVNSLTAGFQYAIYSDCAGTEVSCNAGATGLTDGSTYYIRITDDGTGTTRASGAFSFTPSTVALSTNDFDSELGFTYYPNPVKNTLTLNAQQNIETVTMYNMLGQEVLRVSPNSVDATVDMSNLTTGAYFAQVSILGSTQTVRIIKQ